MSANANAEHICLVSGGGGQDSLEGVPLVGLLDGLQDALVDAEADGDGEQRQANVGADADDAARRQRQQQQQHRAEHHARRLHIAPVQQIHH